MLGDERAWSDLYTLYCNLVSSWILHCAPAAVLAQEEVTSLINAAFARLARSVPAQNFSHFSTVETLFGYFKRCTRSVLFDELRRRQAQRSWEIASEATLETIE